MKFAYTVNGIFSGVDNPEEWVFQAQSWLKSHGYDEAAGLNYGTDAVGGALTRNQLGDIAAKDLQQAQEVGFDVDAIGHSNGCPVLLNAIGRYPHLRIRNLHLIAPAMPQECDLNGLNLVVGQLGTVTLYVSPNDEVLGLPVISYGQLGKLGPTNISDELQKKLRIIKGSCGHSEWVAKYFYQTMQQISEDA